MGGACSTNGEKRNECRLLVGKPEGKRPLGKPRRRWVDNIRTDLGKVVWDDVYWAGLSQDRDRWRALVNSVLNLRIPYNSGKLSNGLTTGGLSSRAQLQRGSFYLCTLRNHVFLYVTYFLFLNCDEIELTR
jgi:hypothetical protein